MNWSGCTGLNAIGLWRESMSGRLQSGGGPFKETRFFRMVI